MSAVIIMAIMGGFFYAGHVAAQEKTSDLAAKVASNDPLKPVLRLENISDHACQVATTAQGTVAITKVMQDGKLLRPAAVDGAFSEDLGYLLKSQMKTLKPGEFIEIPLQVYTLKSGPILRSTTWSSDAGAFSQQYAVKAGQQLKMDTSYSLPLTPGNGAPVCGTVFATNFTGTRQISPMFASIIAVVVIVLIALIVWLIRKRRQRTAGAAIVSGLLLIVGVACLLHAPAPRAYADVIVPAGMQSQFDSCMALFEANRDITGPALDILNDPANHVEIVRTSGGSDMTGVRNESGGLDITIYWNPDDRHAYAGTGGNADMCTPLYHELSHAVDMHNGTFTRRDCGGIETKEVVATRAQNVLRERLGMPPRSHYGDIPLPSGDCLDPANPAQCTGEHCADTNGDPHVRTFDGLRYDFQAAGEFIAARNRSGSYEIQVRQEPWETSRIVSLNTSVALKIGKDRLEIRAGTALKLLVNGKGQTLEAKDLPGGGRLDIESSVIVLTWPDKSKAYVRSVGSYGLALSVQPSQQLAGELEGLFGDANGNSNNDLRTRGSTATIKPAHKELYPAFADSWRIASKSSLFTYDRGKTTETYTDRSFPDESPNPKTLPGYAAAETFCKSMGITDPVVLANCALDVAITGRPEFARAAAHSQLFAAGADFGGTTWQLAIKSPGETPSVTFDAAANEKIFVHVPQSSLPSQCGILELLRPDGQEIMSGCIINGTGEIDGFVLPVEGKYTIRLAPSSGAVGQATIRLLRITDQHATIVPDGKPVTATINKPGVVSYHTFSGQAGQRVYVDIPSSTLVSQCGIVRMLKPDGDEFASGCIINRKGEVDTLVLPVSGQYTIAVNPNETVTGTAQLRLILPTAETRVITMDGPTLSASLTKPGSIAQFTFDGVAGQRIYIDLPNSELPSQCGILDLKEPDGDIVASGCIINHKGDLADDGFVLPATGRYTLALDPNDDATGKTTIRLRSR
ncbi:MAG TPA: VWD domain-containing protein [Candidatus Saccharimonadales bacterium]|nr:VWD domain-containing protein [Candidatus Saccharimonadales bacterium]